MKFSENSIKKIVIIFIVVFIALLLLALGLFIRDRVIQSKIKSQSNLTKVSEEQILFPTLSQGGNKVLYFSASKEPAFYEQNLEGKDVKKISQNMDTPEIISWSPNKKYALLSLIYDQYIFEKYGSPFASPGTPDQNVVTWLFDLENQKLSKLDNISGTVIWTNDNRLIFQKIVEDKSTLHTANADGGNEELLIDLPSNETYSFSLLPNNQLVLCSEPTDESGSMIYNLNLTGRKLTKIKETDLPATALGLENGNILISVQGAKKHKIYLFDSATNKEKELNLDSSLDSLVGIGNNKIIVTGQTKNLNNQLITFDISTGKHISVANLVDSNTDIFNLFTSLDKKILYFTDNNVLYKANVPEL